MDGLLSSENKETYQSRPPGHGKILSVRKQKGNNHKDIFDNSPKPRYANNNIKPFWA